MGKKQTKKTRKGDESQRRKINDKEGNKMRAQGKEEQRQVGQQ